jgi:hypothetical protein
MWDIIIIIIIIFSGDDLKSRNLSQIINKWYTVIIKKKEKDLNVYCDKVCKLKIELCNIMCNS